MGVNTSIYGEQDNWVSFGGTHENLDNSYCYANFGSSTSYDVNSSQTILYVLSMPNSKYIAQITLSTTSADKNSTFLIDDFFEYLIISSNPMSFAT